MRRNFYIIIIVVLIALCMLCVGALLWPQPEDVEEEAATYESVIAAVEEAVAGRASETLPAESHSVFEDTEIEEEPEYSSVESAEVPTEPYVSPVDFEALWEVNTDIYAWIYIPNTSISYPILQHETDDSYYLTHDSQKNLSKLEGSIFTEKTYNSKDFTDPVTIVYGHRLSTGTMFSTLQSTYSEAAGFESCREIVIFLPDRELHYTVFAAVPYDNRHILFNYNFESSRMYNAFLDSVYEIREIGAVFDDSISVTPEDQMLILSTCLYGNGQKRYLVLAKCEVDIT